ncbi:MAG TPA: hypothetical protein VN851_04705 [Thermoanaerobaculia bacterium]|nr:hypothetical protein [Thermoanaerobaculia bacterium]
MPRSIFLRSVLFSLAGWALGFPAQAVTASRAADINPGFRSESSFPRFFATIGGRALFFGPNRALWSTAGVPDDPVRLGPAGLTDVFSATEAGGRAYFGGCDESVCGLWTTEGTSASTRRLLRTANNSSDRIEAVVPAGLPRTLLIFTPNFEPLLWRTDGTAAGTLRVTLTARRPRELVAFQGKGWFFADLPGAPGALFSSDGLPGGTRRVGTSTGGSRLFPMGNRLMFFVGRDLWSSDGTKAGTRRLATLPNDTVGGAVAGSRLFLATGDPLFEQRDLWISDGTPAGTRRVASYLAGDGNGQLLALGGRVGFYARDAAHGVELWSSDGTAAGTRLVKDVCPGVCRGAWEIAGAGLGRIWFAGSTPARGIELWTSDLTPAGTRLLRDTCPGTCDGNARFFFAIGNRMYFNAGANNLWVSDGTPGGTLRLTASDTSGFVGGFGVPLSGSRIAFAWFDTEHGVEPWVSDGTPAGTLRIADLESGNLAGSDPQTFMSAGGRAFFFADDGTSGRELWVSDGTEEGTHLAYDQSPGPDWSPILQVVASGEAEGRLTMFARESFDEIELIGSDGTPAGTNKLLPEEVLPTGSQLHAGDRTFFFADDPVHGRELWATDGTPGGTVRLTDFVPSSPFRPSGGLPALYALGDRAIIPALLPGGGEELWISDGTAGGTKPLHEVYPFLEAPFSRGLGQPVQLGAVWYLPVADADTATLWRTDLTPGGTARIDALDLSSSARGWIPVVLGERVFVFGQSPSGGALWVSDGTAPGTRFVRSVSFNLFYKPIPFAGRFWFLTNSFNELWATDGTTAGTAEFQREGQSIGGRLLHVVGDRLVIATGDRLVPFLATDGTPAGTAPVEVPGRHPANSFLPLRVGGQLFFPWDDDTAGTELWVLRPE